MTERQRERQRIARYEREMADLYKQIWTLKEMLGEAPPCPTCERRVQLERFPQGAGINWEKLSADRSSMLNKTKKSQGEDR